MQMYCKVSKPTTRTKNGKNYRYLPLDAIVLLSSVILLSFAATTFCIDSQWVLIFVHAKYDTQLHSERTMHWH